MPGLVRRLAVELRRVQRQPQFLRRPVGQFLRVLRFGRLRAAEHVRRAARRSRPRRPPGIAFGATSSSFSRSFDRGSVRINSSVQPSSSSALNATAKKPDASASTSGPCLRTASTVPRRCALHRYSPSRSYRCCPAAGLSDMKFCIATRTGNSMSFCRYASRTLRYRYSFSSAPELRRDLLDRHLHAELLPAPVGQRLGAVGARQEPLALGQVHRLHRRLGPRRRGTRSASPAAIFFRSFSVSLQAVPRVDRPASAPTTSSPSRPRPGSGSRRAAPA